MLKWGLFSLAVALSAASLMTVARDASDTASIVAFVLALLAGATVVGSRVRRRFRNWILIFWVVIGPITLIFAAWGPGFAMARLLLAGSVAVGTLAAVWSVNRRRRTQMMEGYLTY